MNRQITRILCVDDEPLNLRLLEAMLSPRGYEVVTVESGLEALERIRTERIDICLLDVMMPGMDGFEVCRRIKSEEEYATIPVILITAFAALENRIRGIEAGAEDFISKPFDATEVLARITMLLQVKELSDQLKSARMIAEKANLAKSEFLSSMSHELRSPLNAILGFTQLMETDATPPTPSQRESISQILRAGWHLLALINEILDLAKIESRQVSLLAEPVSLGEIMRECQGMIEPQAQQLGIQISYPQFELPCFVLADRTRLKQVLINLLSNAVKYNSPQGIVELKCAESTPGRICVSIRDTGVGLSQEQLGQLFQPFNRLGQETGLVEGTGIGLVVTKQLVELMGGNIGVESTVGAGSVFWFELVAVAGPVQTIDASDTVPFADADQVRGIWQHTLLYIEDIPANLALVEQIIARHPDIRLLTALNGISGVEIARSSLPDLILTDINLPDLNGYEVLKILAADPTTAHIPVIAISANAMPIDIQKGLNAGFFRYITKPIKVEEFMHVLDFACEYSDQHTGQQPVYREEFH
jgi:signal transduction histidine kinase